VLGWAAADTHSGVSEGTLRDSLKKCRFSNICKTDLRTISLKKKLRRVEYTYDSTLQVIARPAQQDLLFLGSFLRRHLSSFCVRSGCCGQDLAVKQALIWGHSSCCRPLESEGERREDGLSNSGSRRRGVVCVRVVGTSLAQAVLCDELD
jgi:hypothetical protein